MSCNWYIISIAILQIQYLDMLYIGQKYVAYFLEGYVLISLNLYSLILEVRMVCYDVFVSTSFLNEENITCQN